MSTGIFNFIILTFLLLGTRTTELANKEGRCYRVNFVVSQLSVSDCSWSNSDIKI